MSDKLMINAAVIVGPGTWTEFKKYFDGTYKYLHMQYTDAGTGYELFGIDGNIAYRYFLYYYGTEKYGLDKTQNDLDVTDFNDHYKATCNQKLLTEVRIKQNYLVPVDLAVTVEEGFELDIAIGVNPSVKVIGFPYNVDLIGGRTYLESAELGDYVHIFAEAKTDPALGAMTAAANENDTIIYVDDTIYANVRSGYYLKLGTEADYYRVDALGSSNAVTISPGLTENKADDTEVRIRVASAYRKWVKSGVMCDVGLQVLEPSPFDTSHEMRIEYHHVTTPVATGKIRLNMIYRY
jgi:hypothetical protein